MTAADYWTFTYVGSVSVFLLYRAVARIRGGRVGAALVYVALLESMVVAAVGFTPLRRHFTSHALTLIATAVMVLVAVTLAAAVIASEWRRLRHIGGRVLAMRGPSLPRFD